MSDFWENLKEIHNLSYQEDSEIVLDKSFPNLNSFYDRGKYGH